MPFISSIRGNFGPQGRLNSRLFDPTEVTGGTITTAGGYRIHTFLLANSGSTFSTLSAATAPVSLEYLVVAGGGGAAGGPAGGAGAGGMIVGSGSFESAAYTVTVGKGSNTVDFFEPGEVVPAVAPATPSPVKTGRPSFFTPSITAIGGGLGFSPGGSGGNAGNGTPGQGNPGGSNTHVAPSGYGKAGGGGAGSAGEPPPPSRAGNGGNGANSSITGSAVTYAGGGGGGTYNGTAGAGGPGGGGPGRSNGGSPSSGTPGTASTGGGAGAGNFFGPNPKSSTGGPGIVVIRYLL